MAFVSPAELRALLYIARKAFGYGREADRISTSRLVHATSARDGPWIDLGTCVSRSCADTAIKGLEKKGLIVLERRISRAGDRDLATFRLRLSDTEVQKLDHGGAVIA